MSQISINILKNNPFDFALLPEDQQTEEIALFALSLSPNVFSLIPKRLHTTNVCLAAITNDVTTETETVIKKGVVANLQYIDNQSDDLCIRALELDEDAIKYITNFSTKVSRYFISRTSSENSNMIPKGKYCIGKIFCIDKKHHTVQLWEELFLHYNFTDIRQVLGIRSDVLNKLGNVARRKIIKRIPCAIKLFDYSQKDFMYLVSLEDTKTCLFCHKSIDRTKKRVDNCGSYCPSKKHLNKELVVTNPDEFKTLSKAWRLLEYVKTGHITEYLKPILNSECDEFDQDELVKVMVLYTKEIIDYLLNMGKNTVRGVFIDNVYPIIIKYFSNADTEFSKCMNILKIFLEASHTKTCSKIDELLSNRILEKRELYELFKIVDDTSKIIKKPNYMSNEDYYEVLAKFCIKKSITSTMTRSGYGAPDWIKSFNPSPENENNIVLKIIEEVYDELQIKDKIISDQQTNQPNPKITQEADSIVKTKLNSDLNGEPHSQLTVEPNSHLIVEPKCVEPKYVEPDYCEIFNPTAKKTYNKYVKAIKNKPEWIIHVPIHLLTRNICKIALEGGCDRSKIPLQYQTLLHICPEPTNAWLILHCHITKNITTSVCEKWNWKDTQKYLEDTYKVPIVRIYKKKSNEICFYATKPKFVKISKAILYESK